MSIKVPAQRPRSTPCLLAFIGEAPGEEEEIDLKPLVGPSGRIYNGLLRAAGIDRRDVLTTNVFDEKAPDNDVTPWMKDEQRSYHAFCRLWREIEECQPSVIVPMGATPLWALTGDTAIGKARGNIMPVKGPGGAVWKCLPTFHPAFVMRQWKFLPVVLGDFIKARTQAQKGGGIIYPLRRWWLEPTLEDVRTCMDSCLKAPEIGQDIETGWGMVTCMSFSWTREDGICVPFVDLRKPTRSYWETLDEEVEAWRMVREVLESPVPKIGQNYVYDVSWLREKMGINVMNYREDTRLIHHALYPELPKDLGFLGGSYSEQGVWKTWSQTREEKDDA